MARDDVDRNFLFGLLALQTGLVDCPSLLEALRAWAADKSGDLAEVLADQGTLSTSRRSLLEALVGEHLTAHDGDPSRSLASIEAGESTQEFFRQLGDPELKSTINLIGSASTIEYRRDGRTEDFDIGSSTDGSGRFRVLRPHKRGGLGAVFVALDSELNREVALKRILDRHADDPISRSRFLLEAEITGGLEHPGIVPVYGLGTFADGRPYYAMRFIRGDSLKDAIAQFHRKEQAAELPDPGSRELGLRKLLRRFLDVCNAIEYAHRRGVLHRDLKPANVMVGKYGETLVVDWGLAKAVGRPDPVEAGGELVLSPAHSSGSVETLPGSAIGTPAYMSPEQADGDLARLGPRSDVYSLGATLYCLLTGRPPYEGAVAWEILPLVRAGRPCPPRKHDPRIDRALEAICLKAMAHKPEDRYPTPASLAEEVDRWMADEPVQAFPDSKARKVARWGRRHSSAVTGGVVSLVLTVFGLILITWLVARQNARLEAARLEARAAGGMAHKAVRTMLKEVAMNDLLNIPQGELLRLKLAERALELYRDFVKLHPEDPEFALEHSRIEEQVASLYRGIGRYDRASETYVNAIARLGGLLKLDPGSRDVLEFLSFVESQFAESIKAAGKSDAQAEPHQREAIRLAVELQARYPEVSNYARLVAFTSNDFAARLTNAGRHDQAEPVIERGVAAALAFRATLPKEPDPKKLTLDWVILPMVQTTRGTIRTRLGRGREAEESIRPAVDSLRALLLVYPRSTDVKYLLSAALMELGDAKATDPAGRVEALGHLDEAVTLFTPLVTEYPNFAAYPRFLVSLRLDRGSIRLASNRLEPARDDLAFAAEKLDERLRLEKKESADLLGQLGKAKAALARLADREGDRAKARVLADDAVVLQRRALAIEPTRRADQDLLDKHLALVQELAGPAR